MSNRRLLRLILAQIDSLHQGACNDSKGNEYFRTQAVRICRQLNIALNEQDSYRNEKRRLALRRVTKPHPEAKG